MNPLDGNGLDDTGAASRQAAINPATDPTTLLRLLGDQPELGTTIASHPGLTDELLHALAALEDPAVDAILAWRQAPVGGWRRQLRPGAMPEADLAVREDSLSGAATIPDTIVATAADTATPSEGASGSKRRTRAIVAGTIAAALVVVAGTGWWLNSRYAPTPTPNATTDISQFPGEPEGAPVDSILAQRFWLNPYPTVPESNWRLDPVDVLNLARTVEPTLGSDGLNYSLEGVGDHGILAVSGSVINDSDEDWASVSVGFDLSRGVTTAAVNPSQIMPGERYLQCESAPSFDWCRNASDSATVVIDPATGVATVHEGDFSRRVGDAMLSFTAATSEAEGAENSSKKTMSVTVTATRLDATLWTTTLQVSRVRLCGRGS